MFLRFSGPIPRDENVHGAFELDGDLELQDTIRGVYGDTVRVDGLQYCHEISQFDTARTPG